MKKFLTVFFLFGLTSFFFTKLFQKSLNPHLPTSLNPSVFYSNQQKDDLRWMLFKAIKNAKKSVNVVMFGFTEPSIIHILNQKAKTIPVTIYYDANNSKKLEKILTNVNLHPIKKSAFMHQKILVIDDEQVFIGSANFTTSSLIMHDNLILGLYNPKLAKFILEKSPSQSGYFETFHNNSMLEFWLLPDPRGNGLNAVLKTLRKATKSIKIAIFTFTHPGVIQELILAKNRGVKVEVTIDFGTSLGVSSKTIKKLKEEKINILIAQGMQLLHHKFILIDDQILITGSANLTKAAFYKNNDCFLIMRLRDPQKKFMLKLWNKITLEAR